MKSDTAAVEDRIPTASAEAAPRDAREGHRSLRLWLRLLTTTGLIEKELRARLRERFGTTLPRFDVLAALTRRPEGQTMGELSRWLLVSKGNVTGVVRRLEAEGLVTTVRPHGDRRSRLVRLTPAGRRVFRRWSEAHEAWIEELLAGLEDQEMDALHGLLAKTKRHLTDPRPRESGPSSRLEEARR